MKLLFFDLETTGPDPKTDNIVEIALMDQDGTCWNTYVDPERPIPPGATAVHGISDAMVAKAPKFADIAVRVQGYVDGRVLVGYNSKSFDARLLDRQLREAGQRGIDPDQEHIDLYVLWQELEKRTLANAVKRFAPEHVLQAHSAVGDVLGTQAIYKRMAFEFQLDHERAAKLTAEADITRWVQLIDEVWCWKFGKNRGKPVKADVSYAQWVLNADFPPSLKRLIEKELLP